MVKMPRMFESDLIDKPKSMPGSNTLRLGPTEEQPMCDRLSFDSSIVSCRLWS